MNQKPSRQEILDERQHLFDAHRNFLSPAMENIEKIHADMLQSMALHCNRSYLLLNLNKGQFTHHYSCNSKYLNHFNIQTHDKENWQHILRLYPEEDLLPICETEIEYYKLLTTESIDLHHQLHLISIRRMMNPNGKYDIYLIRAYVIEFDVLGVPWLVLLEIEKLFAWDTSQFHQLHHLLILNKENNAVVKRMSSGKCKVLTNKELEVLQHAFEGNSIKLSANKLHIIESTVKNYRSTCKEKLNATSMDQAFSVAKSLRIIEEKKKSM